MQMSQQLMAGGMLEGNMPSMIPDMGGMDINKMIAQMKEMIDYIKANYRELMKKIAHRFKSLMNPVKS